MFCVALVELLGCCRFPDSENLSQDLELQIKPFEEKESLRNQGIFNCIYGSGLNDQTKVSIYSSFRPNNSIRYSTSDLHRRFGTDQLSILPKFGSSRLGDFEEASPGNNPTGPLSNSVDANSKLMRFIQILIGGIMVKQIVDTSTGDTKYIAMYLSKNQNSFIFDNFGGVLLEVPLKSIVGVAFNDFSSDGKSLISEFSIRKGYEPIKARESNNFIVSIDLGAQMKPIYLTFGSSSDGVSFCTGIESLLNLLNLKT
ncbi:hypothetical protein HWI79_621 [Cryptosporidium felis]|nr:hypothetical protein HWI79_621 [Cryptosporidium felis]